MSVLTPIDFCHAWTIFGPLVDKKHSKGGVSRTPSQRHMKFEFHQNQVSASEEFSGHFSKCFCRHAWAIFGPLVDKNIQKGESVELPASDTWSLSFIRNRYLPLKSFLDFFLNVLPYQLESWFIHWVGCTTYWVHVSLGWGPCDLHVLSLGTVN